jgi:hypothetical protein
MVALPTGNENFTEVVNPRAECPFRNDVQGATGARHTFGRRMRRDFIA